MPYILYSYMFNVENEIKDRIEIIKDKISNEPNELKLEILLQELDSLIEALNYLETLFERGIS